MQHSASCGIDSACFSKWKPRAVLELSCRRKQSDWADFEVRRSERNIDIPSATQADKRSWILAADSGVTQTGELTIPPLEVHYTTNATESIYKTLSTSAIPVSPSRVSWKIGPTRRDFAISNRQLTFRFRRPNHAAGLHGRVVSGRAVIASLLILAVGKISSTWTFASCVALVRSRN